MLVMFGGINPKNAQVSMGGVTRHETSNWLKAFSDRGMELVNISPQRGDAPEEAEWMPVIPGSDTALDARAGACVGNAGPVRSRNS